MSAIRAWDRAGSLPVPYAGRRLPEIAALRAELPGRRRAVHVHARRGAPVHDAPDAHRGARLDPRGEEMIVHDVSLRHPGEVKVLSSAPGGRHDRRLRDVGLRRHDGPDVRGLAQGRAPGGRSAPTVRGVTDDGDLPGRSRVYVPVTALQTESLPDLFVHPAGYCQNVLATGACRVTGTTFVGGPRGDRPRCDHPRTIELTADRPDFAIRPLRRPRRRRDPAARGVHRRPDHPRRDRHQLRPRRAAAAVRVRVHASRRTRPSSTSHGRPGGAARRRGRSGLGRARGAFPANRTRIAEPAIVITIVARTAVNSSPRDGARREADPGQHVAELAHLAEADRELDGPGLQPGEPGEDPRQQDLRDDDERDEQGDLRHGGGQRCRDR